MPALCAPRPLLLMHHIHGRFDASSVPTPAPASPRKLVAFPMLDVVCAWNAAQELAGEYQGHWSGQGFACGNQLRWQVARIVRQGLVVLLKVSSRSSLRFPFN
ncbi:unnamed protein product [Ostreobium quekettii]|uniref:Uncharacterized protein n=1 Tax=Ostreobium quekettii TaxID=121088 RepID=A0A8S1J5P8_9CHLO|nr:unnamed protein product [Ostreobium quekettii]